MASILQIVGLSAPTSSIKRNKQSRLSQPFLGTNYSHIDKRSSTRTTTHSAADKRKNPDLYTTLEQPTTDPTTTTSTSTSKNTSTTTRRSTKPEVLSPAGGWPQLTAAVENGADAVYFGVSEKFNARARASNFQPEELPRVMQYLHQRGVKGYLTLNVLIFQEELPALEERVREAALAGVDAVIVQDIGAVSLIRRAAPGLPVHGSTQMSITGPDGADFAYTQGVERVVVGRELSLKDISAVSAGTHAEVEAFVHGALCVSYSGQCFSSEAWGGRSANRGQCAQACRLPYGMIVDGELNTLGDISYLLSPQDLAAIDLVPELIEAGVVSFKIEGRLKGPEYVAITTAAYRKAVDAAWTSYTSSTNSIDTESTKNRVLISEEERRELTQVFARGQDATYNGLTPGFLLGPRHQTLVRGRAPRHRGVFIGHVLKVTRRGITVKLAAPLRQGDGLVVDAGDPQGKEEGGVIYQLNSSSTNKDEEAGPASYDVGATVEVVFGHGQVNLANIYPGQLLWKTRDLVLERKIHNTYQNLAASDVRRLPVSATVSGSLGEGLVIELTLLSRDDGTSIIGAIATTERPLEAATKRGVAAADIQKALGLHLGDEDGDAYVLQGDVDCSGLDEGLFIPAGEIKAARRLAVAQLTQQLIRANTRAVAAETTVVDDMMTQITTTSSTYTSPKSTTTKPLVLRVLCRTKQQVEAACKIEWLSEIILDFLEVHGLTEAVAQVKSSNKRAIVASPRVIKPDERRLWLFYLRLGADALLVRSAGLLHTLHDELGGQGATVTTANNETYTIPALEGDFSLNAANVLSADVLLNKGLTRLTPTHDLNAEQLIELGYLLNSTNRAQLLECIVHQHLPIFHTEHCVFARFLSDGDSFIDCGKPCERHTVHLRDPNGRDSLVLADQGCRNTVFDAMAQSALNFLPSLVKAGYGCFRIELVDEPAHVVGPLLNKYKTVLDDSVLLMNDNKDVDGIVKRRDEVWKWLDTLPDANGRSHGVGEGSFKVQVEKGLASMKPTAASTRFTGGGAGGGGYKH